MYDDWDDAGYDSLEQIEAFYHASPGSFLPGTVLEPQAKKNFACSQGYVYLTDSPRPHYTVEATARSENWLVYQVEPLGPLRLGRWDDLICEAARVLTCLGPVSRFPGNSTIVMRLRAYTPPAQVVLEGAA